MKSSVENLGPTRVKLAVEVPFDELKSSLDAAYKKIGSQIRIPGFRPGKAPARIIDQRVGRAAVLEEAVNDALPKAYDEAVVESGVKALGQPEIEVTNLDDGTSLSFTAEVDIRPEIALPKLEGIDVTVDDVEVTEAEIDEQLDALRERFATLVGVDRAVETGDFVSIDLSRECGRRGGRRRLGHRSVLRGRRERPHRRPRRSGHRQVGRRHRRVPDDAAPGRQGRRAGRRHSRP